MVRQTGLLILLTLGSWAAHAQGRFSGGKGGGEAVLHVGAASASRIYTYPNPARVGERVHLVGEQEDLVSKPKMTEFQGADILIFTTPGVYVLKLKTKWLKQVVY